MFVKDEIATGRLRLSRLVSSCLVASVVLAASLVLSASLIAAHAEEAHVNFATQPTLSQAAAQDELQAAAALRIRDGLTVLALAGGAAGGFAIWRRRLRGLVLSRTAPHAV